jgi:hypothetical protein
MGKFSISSDVLIFPKPETDIRLPDTPIIAETMGGKIRPSLSSRGACGKRHAPGAKVAFCRGRAATLAKAMRKIILKELSHSLLTAFMRLSSDRATIRLISIRLSQQFAAANFPQEVARSWNYQQRNGVLGAFV